MTFGPDDLVVTRWQGRFRGWVFPCAVGKAGITRTKREGDGATPAGTFRLLSVGWRPDRTGRPTACLPSRPIGRIDIWSDDPADPRYNQPLRTADHPFRHERLHRADPLYDLIGFTDHNAEGRPGDGSAIFLHGWRAPRRGTEGCVALHPLVLRKVLDAWRPWSRLIVQP